MLRFAFSVLVELDDVVMLEARVDYTFLYCESFCERIVQSVLHDLFLDYLLNVARELVFNVIKERESYEKPSALCARAKKFTTTTTAVRRHESCPLFLDSQRL